MFDHDHRPNWQQSGSQRFGNENHLWSNEPSADSLEKLQRMGNLLAMRLGPEYLTTRQGPGGSKLTYLEGWRAISLANEVFGFNGWSSSVKDISIDFLDYSEEAGRWSVHVTAIVRITLPDGCYHEDVGCGKMDNCKSKADALDKVKKEAVTDAMKRALRNFGNLMGNCIYDKKFLDDISKVKAPGKVPLDFSTLHRPGQSYDIDGKIIPAGVKAELTKAPVAGPSNAGQAAHPNAAVQEAKSVKQSNNHQAAQIKRDPAQAKQPMPVQRSPQPTLQGQQRQANPLQADDVRLQNPHNNHQSYVPALRSIPSRNQGAPLAVVTNRMQIDADRSLNSEDMYEGMEDGYNDIEEETVDTKYEDSGFDDGTTSVHVPAERLPPDPALLNHHNRTLLPQIDQTRASRPQHQPYQIVQRQSVRTETQILETAVAPNQDDPGHRQQVDQNHGICAKQGHSVSGPQNHARGSSGGDRKSVVHERPRQEQNGDNVDQDYAYAPIQPDRSRGTSEHQSKQGQNGSPLNRLDSQLPHPRHSSTSYAQTNEMSSMVPVKFRSSSTGVKRPLPSDVDPVTDDKITVNPAVQQAQQGQQGIRRAMSPSERARIAEQQAQQQQLIAQKREAAQEKRQRLQSGRSSGHKPVSA